MSKDNIITILRELYNISGFTVSLYDTSLREIATYPRRKNDFCRYIQDSNENECEQCEICYADAFAKAIKSAEPIIQRCRYNLIKAVCPLFNFNILTGFLVIGELRADGESVNAMMSALRKIGKKESDARGIIAAIPSNKESIIKSYVNVMTICASHLTLSNTIAQKASVGQLTMKFIGENFTEKIGVKDICKAVGYSKSTVLTAFKKEFSTTVNSYINTLRLERAKKMLESDNTSISEIALSSGFSDQSYFSKVFFSTYGVTPTEYRRDR